MTRTKNMTKTPALTTSERVMLGVHVDPDIRDALSSEAAERGLTKAAFLRALLTERYNGQRIPARKPHGLEREALREVNRLGTLLNQIARAINTYAPVGAVLRVERELENLDHLSADIQGALAKLVKPLT